MAWVVAVHRKGVHSMGCSRLKGVCGIGCSRRKGVWHTWVVARGRECDMGCSRGREFVA